MRLLPAAALVCACLIAGTTAGAEEIGRPDACLPSAFHFYVPAWTPVPGLGWSAWAPLLGAAWSERERAQPGWFDTERLVSALHWVPPASYPAPDRYFRGLQDTPPLGDDFDPAVRAYLRAADLFHAGQWRDAIAGFDQVGGAPSTVGARAAYSAARAAYDLGDAEDGLRRTGALFATQQDRDMALAAHDLLGTMEWDTGASSLLAARLEEISHLLMTPAELRCANRALGALEASAIGDLEHIVTYAYPTDHWTEGDWAASRQAVFDAVGRHDPVIDLVRVLSIPSPYRGSRLWTDAFDPANPHPGFSRYDTDAILQYDERRDADRTYARNRAADLNPLWAFALAQLTGSPADLPLLSRAANALAGTHEIDAGDRDTLRAWLTAHQVRILLKNGRQSEAERMLADNGPLLLAGSDPNRADGFGCSFGCSVVLPASFVAVGGARLLLARKDYEAARHWADATAFLSGQGASFDVWIDTPLGLPLARTWQEVLSPGLRSRPPAMQSATAAALDLLPSEQILTLARTPGLARTWRRPMLAATFIRRVLLGRWRAAASMAAELRSDFPELAPALTGIGEAWLPSTRRHRIVLLLLREPGLSPRVLWNRDVDLFYRNDRQRSVAALDPWNPNDGNWWCPLAVGRAKIDAFAGMFQSLSVDWWRVPEWFEGVSLTNGGTSPDERLANAWLALSPLYAGIDDDELARLAKAESGPYGLSNIVLKWARDSTWLPRWLGLDKDIPEALALAVRSTRYGCRRAEPLGGVSRAAWVMLHRRYPASAEAKGTPFWFDGHFHSYRVPP